MGNSLFLVVSIVPIIAFVIADIYLDLKKSIMISFGLSVILALAFFFYRAEPDYSLFLEPIVLLIVGFVSIKMQSKTLFKLQPAMVGLILTIYLAILQWFFTPIMIRFLPEMKPILEQANPEAAAMFSSPLGQLKLIALSRNWIIVFLLHSLFMIYLALKVRNFWWLMGRLMIYPLLVIVGIVTLI